MPVMRLCGARLDGARLGERRNSAQALTRAATVIAAAVLAMLGPVAQAAPPLRGPPVEIAYIEKQVEHLPPLNNEDPIPDDLGRKGAELGLSDSNATGRFVGVAVALKPTIVPPDGDFAAAVKAVLAKDKPQFVIVNASPADLLKAADLPETQGALLFNINATDNGLRGADCRANVLHVAPSRAMLTDALVQFLVFKRWPRILLVSGPHPDDKAYAESLKHSAKKFGAKIVGETSFDVHGADIRDTALREFILVTRGADHDVVAVADEANEFGASLVYNTDLPRPVVGTHGLTPAAWGRAVEAWSAVQLQNRFKKLAGRVMRPEDYAGWMAAHVVGEAGVQLKSADPTAIRKLIVSPGFEVGGFKGRSLSFRAWDGQMREPIFDLWPGAVVAAAPLEGFLHPATDLDSLGLDAPESACKLKRG